MINLLFPILSFPYASRILGPYGIGKVQFITSFAQYFALIAALGIPVYGIREIARSRGNKKELSKTFMELVIIFMASSIFIGIIYLFIAFNIDSLKVDFHFHIYASFVVFLAFSSIDWFYAGIEEFRTIAIRSTIVKVLALFLLYFFVNNKNDLFLYFILTLFTLLGNNIINIFSVWRKIEFTLQNLNFKQHVRPLVLIFGTTLASSMYTLFDVIILGFLSDEKAVGYYTSGVKLSKVSIPFVISLGAVLIPTITTYLKEKKITEFLDVIEKSYSFLIFLSVPIGIGFLILAKEFILVFSGPQFVASIVPMQIMAFLPFFIGLGYLFGIQILIPAKMDKQLLISVVFGMIISILLNLILVPIYQEKGSSIANLASEIVVTSCYYFFVKDRFNLKLSGTLILQAFCSSIIFLPVYLLFKLVFEGNFLNILISSVMVGGISYCVIQFFFFKNQVITEIFDTVLKRNKNEF